MFFVITMVQIKEFDFFFFSTVENSASICTIQYKYLGLKGFVIYSSVSALTFYSPGKFSPLKKNRLLIALLFLRPEISMGLIFGPVKSKAELPTTRHRCDITSKGAVLPNAQAQ